MEFSMRNFVKQGLLNAVGKQADYQIIQRATGWLEKGVLEISDLEEIQNALNIHNFANNIVMGDVTREVAAPEPVPGSVPEETEAAAQGDETPEPAPDSVPEESGGGRDGE